MRKSPIHRPISETLRELREGPIREKLRYSEKHKRMVPKHKKRPSWKDEYGEPVPRWCDEKPVDVPAAVIADREYRKSLPQSVFGDPLPGMSALDKLRAEGRWP